MTHDKEAPVDSGRGRLDVAPAQRDDEPPATTVSGRRRFEMIELIGTVVPARGLGDPDVREGQERRRSTRQAAAELDLRDAVLTEGFDGFLWVELAGALASYGLEVIRPWIASGVIYQKTAEVGHPVKRIRVPFTYDECLGLAVEVVAAGMCLFRDHGLHQKKWDPARGASMASYFINSCVRSFSNMYAKAVSERENVEQEIACDDVLTPNTLPGASMSAERVALGRLRLLDVFRRIPKPVSRKIMAYTAFGYDESEIYELLKRENTPLSKGRIRSLRHEARKLISDEREGERDV